MQGAFTLWNRAARSAVRITASLNRLSAGTARMGMGWRHPERTKATEAADVSAELDSPVSE